MSPVGKVVAENLMNKIHDYVVGAGSSATALAARLSEDPNVSVLLPEAGGPEPAPINGAEKVPLEGQKMIDRVRNTLG
jgi:choline dehydrogenase-like flavoprotein